MKPNYFKHLNNLIKLIHVPRTVLSVLIILLLFSGNAYGQTTWYSYQSGNWAIGATNWRTWTLDPSGTTLINPTNVNPGIADNVVILNGRIVTIPIGELAKTVASVTIQEGAVLDITNTTGHNFGANLNGAGLLRLSTATFPGFAAGTFVLTGGGTVEYRNMGSFTFSQLTYNNLILNLNNTVDEALFNSVAALTINGNLTIEKGIFKINIDGGGAARTVNCNGNVTVNENGQIRVGTGGFGHIVNVRGNFTNNNGNVNFTNMLGPDYQLLPPNGYATVFFDNDYKDQNISCIGATNGITIFHRIVIDKGVNPDYTYILNIDAERTGQFFLYGRSNQVFGGNPPNITNLDALGLLRGTVRLGQNIDIPSLGRNSFSIDEDAQIWIDGATVDMIDGAASIANISLIVYGKLRMTSSTSVLEATQCTNGVFMRELTNITIEDGTLNATTLRTSYRDDLGVHRGAVIIRGGTINLSGITHDDGNLGHYASFMLPYPTNVFEMSGGTMNINGVTTANAGQSGYRFGILLSCTSNNINVTGGTVNINTGGSDVYINSTAPFYNLNVINAANNIEVRNYAGRPVPRI